MISLLGCFGEALIAQNVLTHFRDIESLSVDSDGLLLVKDTEKYYNIKDHHLFGKEDSFKTTIKKPEYEIEDGRLKRNIGNNFSFYPLPFTPLAIYQWGTRLLCSSEEELWIVQDGKAKKLFVPGQKFPKRVVALHGEEGVIGMLTADADLYLFESSKQILKFVHDRVDDFAIDKWNCLWYSFEKRAIKQDVSFINNKNPILELEKMMSADGELLSEPIVLSAENAGLSIFFSGKYPPSFDQLVYSYNIDGGEWKGASSEEMIVIRSKLEPGSHKIRLKAESANGKSVLSSPIRVKVESAGLNFLWPLLFGGLAVLAFLMWLSHQRLQKTMSDLTAEKERILMELQVANEKQKIGQLQMNPHFIFNTLNSISGLIALNENKNARTQLNKFSQMMRSVLGNSMKEYIPLVEELSFINDYLSLEQLIRNDKFSFEVESDVQEGCLVPPMIIQPFLENAIVHGLSRKEGKGNLNLVMKDMGKHIEVKIEDNGVGRAEAGKYKKEGHESAALDIIETRLKALNRWNDIGLVYDDLRDEHGKAAGTRVTLHLPKQKV